MKIRNIFNSFFAAAFILTTLSINAQTKFYINKKDGTANQYNIADVDSISFVPSSSSQIVDQNQSAFDKNVSLIASSENSTDIPIVDVVNKVLDLGANPILIIGNKYFELKALWPSNPDKYRAIPLTITGSGMQRVLYFNVATKEFEMKVYTAIVSNDANTVLIGTVYETGQQLNVHLPFLFKYSNLRASVITGSLKNRTDVELMMHRGLCLSQIAPENSLDAAELAGRAGYDWVEGDIQVTSDGKLIVIHDDLLNTALVKYASDYSDIPANIKVNSLNLVDLRANYVLASVNPRMRKPIPTLEEFFITCRDNRIKPTMEIKPGMTQADILKAYELGSEILGDENFCFHESGTAALDYIRTLSDKVNLMYTGSSILGTVNSINGQSREHPKNIWGPNISFSALSPDLVKEYRRKNMRVAITAGPNDFDAAVKMGVNILSSNDTGPNLAGRPGNVITADGNWEKFITNGTVGDYVSMSNGQIIKWEAKNAKNFSAYYVRVTFKGSIRLVGARLNVTKTSDTPYTLISQALVVNMQNSMSVTAMANGTIVYNIEFVSVDL